MGSYPTWLKGAGVGDLHEATALPGAAADVVLDIHALDAQSLVYFISIFHLDIAGASRIIDLGSGEGGKDLEINHGRRPADSGRDRFDLELGVACIRIIVSISRLDAP